MYVENLMRDYGQVAANFKKPIGRVNRASALLGLRMVKGGACEWCQLLANQDLLGSVSPRSVQLYVSSENSSEEFQVSTVK